jgi:peptidoglycan/LPS O-acetylase OafA/YrhL
VSAKKKPPARSANPAARPARGAQPAYRMRRFPPLPWRLKAALALGWLAAVALILYLTPTWPGRIGLIVVATGVLPLIVVLVRDPSRRTR